MIGPFANSRGNSLAGIEYHVAITLFVHLDLVATISHGSSPTGRLKMAFSDCAPAHQMTCAGEEKEALTLSIARAASIWSLAIWLLYVCRSKRTSRPFQSFTRNITSLLRSSFRRANYATRLTFRQLN